jgi:hypothetical protein
MGNIDSPPQYKSGDRVVITGNSNNHSYSCGDIVYLLRQNHGHGSFKSSRTLDGGAQVAGNILPKDFILADEPEEKIDKGVKGSRIYGYDLSVDKDLTVTMTRRFEGLDTEVSPTNKFNQQEEIDMSNLNRVVSVKFFDDDEGLKAENSLVAEYVVTTRVSNEMTVSKVLLTEDVKEAIEAHNEVRATTVDLHILKNTGNKVFLQPAEFENLRVVVSNV